MLSVFLNIMSVFAITSLGFTAVKFKWLPIESSQYFSKLMIDICSPCLIIYAMSQQELSPSTVSIVKQAMLLMLVVLVISTVLAIIIVKFMKVPKLNRGIYRDLLILTNNGFMGYPLALAVFGEKGMFLMIIANAVFTLFMYSAGVYIMIYDHHKKMNFLYILRSIISPPVIASIAGLFIFYCGISFPAPLENFLDSVGGMTIPLSMLVIGIQLSQSSIRQVMGNRTMSVTIFMRLVALPLLFFLILFKVPIDPMVLCIIVFAMAMPSAAVNVMLADLHGADAKLAAEGVFLTTLFSLITIPVAGMLLTGYLQML